MGARSEFDATAAAVDGDPPLTGDLRVDTAALRAPRVATIPTPAIAPINKAGTSQRRGELHDGALERTLGATSGKIAKWVSAGLAAADSGDRAISGGGVDPSGAVT